MKIFLRIILMGLLMMGIGTIASPDRPHILAQEGDGCVTTWFEETFCPDDDAPTILLDADPVTLPVGEAGYFRLDNVQENIASLILTYEGSRQDIRLEVLDASGERPSYQYGYFQDGADEKIYVYALSPDQTYYVYYAALPYEIDFQAVNADLLGTFVDPLTPGDTIQATFNPREIRLYPLPLAVGDTISITTPGSDLSSPRMRNNRGEIRPLPFAYTDYQTGQEYYAFTAGDDAPYHLVLINYEESAVDADFQTFAGDIFRADQGQVIYEQAMPFSLTDQQLAAWYQVPPDSAGITFTVQNGSVAFLADSSGRRVQQAATFFDADAQRWVSYNLPDPDQTYHFYVFSEQDSVIAAEGEQLRLERGNLPTGIPLEPIPANQVAIYTINAIEGQQLIFQATGIGNQFYPVNIYNTRNNRRLDPINTAIDAFTFAIEETGVYEIHVYDDTPAPLTVVGEIDLESQGVLGVGQPINGVVVNGEMLQYDLAEVDTAYITLATENYRAVPQVLDSQNRQMRLVAELDQYISTNRSIYSRVYALDGTPPYVVRVSPSNAVEIPAGAGNFTLRLEAGDLLRDVRGELVMNETVTGDISDDQVVVYTYEATRPTTLTLEAQNAYSMMHTPNGDTRGGDSIEPLRGEVIVYDLYEAGTYEFHLEGISSGGTYQVTLREGDPRQPQMALNFDETITLPVDIALRSYGLEAATGDLITLSSSSASVTILDAIGEEMIPAFYGMEENPSRTVYSLYGTPPFTVQVFPDSFYSDTSMPSEIMVEAGDLLRRYGGELTLGEPMTDTVAVGEAVYYTFTVEDGTQIEVVTDDLQLRVLPLIDDARNQDMSIVNTYTEDANGVYVWSLANSTSDTYTLLMDNRLGDAPLTSTLQVRQP